MRGNSTVVSSGGQKACGSYVLSTATRRRWPCVGHAKRTPRDQRLPRLEQADDAVIFGRLQRLLQRQRRKNGGQPFGQHRLPRPRWPNQQHIIDHIYWFPFHCSSKRRISSTRGCPMASQIFSAASARAIAWTRSPSWFKTSAESYRSVASPRRSPIAR